MRKSTRTFFTCPYIQHVENYRGREDQWKRKLEKGIKVEQIDHPQLSYTEAKQIAVQELMKDPLVYDK